MIENLKIECCQSAASAREIGLHEFARGFDHEIQPVFPILVGYINGHIRGYMQMEKRWLVTPAIHPDINSPRDTLALAHSTIEILKQSCPGFLLQRDGARDDTFTDRVMDKLGLKPWKYRVYEAR
jgi:hypothetical protein